MHLLVGAAVLIAGMILFSLRYVGGGDAKLLASGALWMGYDQLLPYLAYVTIFGGALALLCWPIGKHLPELCRCRIGRCACTSPALVCLTGSPSPPAPSRSIR